jgi:hypothetical protein
VATSGILKSIGSPTGGKSFFVIRHCEHFTIPTDKNVNVGTDTLNRMLADEPSNVGTKHFQAVTAFREALRERTRERLPLDWATSFGNQGVALMLLAERRRDAAMAKTALSQINTAFETTRDGGDAPSAAYYEWQRPRARAIVARLRGK